MRGSGGVFVAALTLALVAGTGARLANLDRKVFFQDEAYSALRITGHTQAAYLKTFDGAVRPVADILAFQRLDAASSPRATLVSIAEEEPQRGPLYYALAALWVRFSGTSIAGFRSLSVLIGLLEIGAAYFLGRVLLDDGKGGALLAALVALSPFHIRYAQQAREYGLLGCAIFASTGCLVAGLRGGRTVWLAYALACAAGLATSPFFALVIVSHALYALLDTYRQVGGRRRLGAYVAATVAGSAVMLPWFAYASRSAGTVADQTDWGASPYPAVFALTKWIFNIGATFFDYEFADIRFAVVLVVLLPLVVLAVVRCALYERRPSVVALTLALPTLGAFLLKDQLAHGHFATIPRYVMPLWIALEIVVAAGVMSALRAPSRRARRAAGLGLGFVLGCGLWSAVGDSPATMWWDNNDNEPTIAVAGIVNAAPHPVVATSNVAITLSLAHYLNGAVRLQLYPRDALPPLVTRNRLPATEARFVFLPSQHERATLTDAGVVLSNVSPHDETIVRGFHAALQHERPGPRSRSLIELSGANALWQLARGETGACR